MAQFDILSDDDGQNQFQMNTLYYGFIPYLLNESKTNVYNLLDMR